MAGKKGTVAKITPVILSGGSGTRLWPMSRALYPKQLLPLVTNEPLLLEAVKRLDTLVPAERVLILTNETLVPPIAEMCPAIPRQNLIAEPRAGGGR